MDAYYNLKKKIDNHGGFKYMNWDDMTYEQKRNCYESWVQELKDEYGDNATPVPFETFDKEWSGQFYEVI